MKIIIMILLITLSSCGSFPQIPIVERCTTSFDFNRGSDLQRRIFFSTLMRYENPIRSQDFMKDVTQLFGKCRCVQYNMNYPKSIGKGIDKPLSYCNDFIGFHFNTWVKIITPMIKYRRRWVRDNCKKKGSNLICKLK